MCALSLASGSRPAARWFASERNPADRPSRVFSDGPRPRAAAKVTTQDDKSEENVLPAIAEDTVEERILVLQQRKRALAEAALGSADQATAITRDDLMALLA